MKKKRKSSWLLAGIFGVLLCMSFALGACSENVKKTEATYSSELGTFSLEVEVDKTGMNLFETLTVKTTLKNLSGRDIYVELYDPQCMKFHKNEGAKPEEYLTQSSIFPFWCPSSEVGETLIGVSPRERVLLEKDAVVTHTEKVAVTIIKNGNVSLKFLQVGPSKLCCYAGFYVGENFDSEEDFTESVFIYPEELDIFVRWL